MRCDSYWSGGSRAYYVAVNLQSGQSFPVPENGTPFMPEVFQASTLPANWAIVRHTIFCGKDLGLTVSVNAENLQKMLPPARNFTKAQVAVLVFTRERKSSYNGKNRQQMAQDEIGLPAPEWNQARAELIAMGLLNSAGAITNEGRNAASAAHSGQAWSLPKWTVPQLSAEDNPALQSQLAGE
jgi:hypothetical protein